MVLSQEQFQALRTKGLSVDQIVRFEKGEAPQPSLGQKLGKRFGTALNTIKGELSNPNPLSKPLIGLAAGGYVAGAAGDAIGAALAPVFNKASQAVGPVNLPISSRILAPVFKGAQDTFNTIEQKSPKTGQALRDAGNIAMLAPVGKGASLLPKPKIPLPKPKVEDPGRLIGTIVQGKRSDVPKAAEALQDINPKNIKSYKDLDTVLYTNIKDLVKRQDEVLSRDTTLRPLSQLATETKVGEQVVRHNYVNDALSHLKELYSKTNDPTGVARIQQLASKAETQGLTVKEINELARLHGSEFSSKAFSKTGDPLTSVNAQAFENTRSGLKQTARQFVTDPEYQAIDRALTAKIRTQDLIKKVDEQVNKLKQRVTDRGLGEKVGRLFFQALDMFSGGALKGFVQSFIPRSAGLKIMNALDLDAQLQQNLKKLQNILDNVPKKDIEGEIKKLLNQSSNSSKSSTLSASSLTAQKTNMPKSIPNTNNIQSKLPPAGPQSSAYGALGGVQPDEEGNVSFNPLGAALGVGALGIARSPISRIDRQDLTALYKAADHIGSGKSLAADTWQRIQELLASYGMETPKTQKQFADFIETVRQSNFENELNKTIRR